MPEDDLYKAYKGKGDPSRADADRGYLDAGQRKAMERETARAFNNLTGTPVEQFQSRLLNFAQTQQRLPARPQSNPPPLPEFGIDSAQFDPQPLTLGDSSNQIPTGGGIGTGSSSTPLWNVDSQSSGGGQKWQLVSGFICDGLDLTKQLSISNLNTLVSMNTSSGDWLYLEIPITTSPSYPAYGTLTVKAAGSTSMPGGGMAEYDTGTISGQTVFTMSFLRIILAQCVVSGGNFTVSPPLQSKIIYLMKGPVDCYDSSGGNLKTVGAVIPV